MHAKLLQLCLILPLCDPTDWRLFCPWDSPGKNTGAGCHAVLQGISPTTSGKSYNPSNKTKKKKKKNLQISKLSGYNTNWIFFKNIFICWVCQGLALACGDLVSWPGMESWSPDLGAGRLTHCTTREVPTLNHFSFSIFQGKHFIWLKITD